jgi:hypothetical protein
LARQRPGELTSIVKELSGAEPGSKDYLSHYQEGVKKLWDTISSDDQELLREETEKWNSEAPPADVQAK